MLLTILFEKGMDFSAKSFTRPPPVSGQKFGDFGDKKKPKVTAF